MGDQHFEAHRAATKRTYGRRPGVGVPPLELEVDLSRVQPHELYLHRRLANANDKHLAPILNAVDCIVHGALNPRALQCVSWLNTVAQAPNLMAECLAALLGVYEMSPNGMALEIVQVQASGRRCR